MAYDEGLAEIMGDHLADMQGIEAKKMFGGLCFMLNGNMLCGVHKGGGMFRVGKDNEIRALKVERTSPLAFTNKKMCGMLDVSDELVADDVRRDQLMTLAIEFVGSLPAK